MRICRVFLLSLWLSIAPVASAANAVDCSEQFHDQLQSRSVETDEPIVKPKPAVVPDRPHVEPTQDPKPARRAPNPNPNREIKPTHDPKDILPVDLYVKDPLAKKIYDRFPERLRLDLIRAPDEEQDLLVARLKGMGIQNPSDPLDLQKSILADLLRIHELEKGSEAVIEQSIYAYIVREFGESAVEGLTFKIDQKLPERPPVLSPTQAASNRSFGGLKNWFKNLFRSRRAMTPGPESSDPTITGELEIFYQTRREIYNLIAQGVGWQAMERYPRQSVELLLMEPELPRLYDRFYTAFRLANLLSIKLLKAPEQMNTDAIREGSSIGREIVTVEGKPVIDDVGNSYIELASVRGIAVGVNGLALAHEMAKAGFQMATALEATQRMGLTAQERSDLDLATNTNSAEIRQAIYGPLVADRILGNLRLVLGGDPAFYLAVEQVFAIGSPSAFYEIIHLASEPGLASKLDQVARLKQLLRDWVER